MARHGWGLVLGMMALSAFTPAWSSQPFQDSKAAATPTHILLRLESDDSAKRSTGASAAAGFGIPELARIHQRFGIERAASLIPRSEHADQRHPLHNIWIVETPPGTDLDLLLSEYRFVPGVRWAELDRPLTLFELNDSLYQMQWALHNTGQEHPAILRVSGSDNDSLVQSAGRPDADIDADEVLSDPPSEEAVPVVAIVDTGVDPNHPELAGRIWRNPREVAGNGMDDDHNGYTDDANGWDHSGDVFQVPPINNGDANPADYHGHGTHVAGIVAARAGNARGVAGVAGECRIMPLKIFPLALSSVAAQAIVYAVDNGADVISMSWGGPWRTQVLEDAMAYAQAGGVVLCAASGNDSSSVPMYPAGYSGVIAVGASDDFDLVTGFSNYGEHLCLVAPGQDVLSLRANGTDMYAPAETGVHKIGLGYYLASGTSMAAPFVAGAAARLRGVSPGLDPVGVRRLLELSATDLVDPRGDGATLPGWDEISGAGRLNLLGLMQVAPKEAAVVSWPRPFESVSGAVQITGTAQSDRGLSYVLEYGTGTMPQSWVPIVEGPALRKDTILGEWQTDSLDGQYSLRLRVGDSNAVQVRVYVGNSRLAEIHSPVEGDTVTSWSEVVGSASDPLFQAYLLELGEGRAPSEWSVIHHSTQPVVNGTLFSWDAGQRQDGWYSLRLRLITDAGEAAGDTVSFFLRSLFSTSRAWKVPLATSSTALVASYGDLDTDPPLEIVVGTSHGIRAFGPDGQADLALQSRLERIGPCGSPLAIGDTDGDGKDDLVAVSDSGVIWVFPSSEQVRAIKTHDPPLQGAITTVEEYMLPGVFLKDIDGDARDEIHYFPGYGNTLPRSYYVYWSDGKTPLEINRQRFTTWLEFMDYLPADLDGDGEDELYVARQHVYRLNHEGALLDSVALVDSTGRYADARTCSALDIDADGLVELVVLAVTVGSPSTFVVYVLEDDLDLKPGWPRDTGIIGYWNPSDPIFCDLDGDGVREYFISWSDQQLGRISAWRPDGSPLSGNSSYSVWTSSIDPARFRSPVATDLNADGQAEILACATDDMFLNFPVERMIAWNQLGHVLPGWPVIVESGGILPYSSRRQTTACGDIDRDGTTDLMMVTSENNLVFINVPGATFDSATSRVDFWHYNRRLNNTLPVSGRLRVESVAPTRLQADVPASGPVVIGFNLPLEAGQDFNWLVEASGSVSGSHEGTVSYDPFTKTLSFVPSLDFTEQERVTVRVSPSLRSESGSQLARPFHTSFVVGARIPAVVAVYPLPDQRHVERYTRITFGLSTDVDLRSLSDTTLALVGNIHGPYTGTLSYDSVTRVATVVSQVAFAPAEVITATVRPGIASTWGILNDTPFSWSFTIAWPQATSTVPAAYTTGAPRSTFVSATLDGPLPDFAVHDSSLVVYSATTGRCQGEVSYVPSTQTLRFTPDVAFRLGEQITAIVPALKRVWTFGINTVGGVIRFTPPVSYPTATSPLQIAAGDLDGDGTVELCAGRWPSPFVYLLRHTGASAFVLDSVLTGGTVGQVLLADLDADSDPDLVASDQIGHSLAALTNAGDGRFSPPEVLAVPGILACAAADLNGDGHLDLYSQAMSTSEVAVLLNAAGGTFSEAPRLVVTAALTTAVAFDFNSDGRQDLAAGDQLGNVKLFAGDGAGGFAPIVAWNTGSKALHLAAGDCDRDGDADLLVLNAGGELNLWRNESEGSFRLDAGYSVSPDAQQVRWVDFDADGRLDVAVAGGADRTVFLLAGTSTGRFTPLTELAFGDSVSSVVVADFDADGDLDLATGGQRSLGVAYFGSGSAVGEETTPVVPDHFELSQNYPNPFNPSTTVGFAVPEASRVNVAVFNILGRQVAVLKDEVLAPGYYNLTWDGRSNQGTLLPSGMYFYRLTSQRITLTRRMLLLK